MGNFFSTEFWMSEDNKIAQMSPQARTDYMKCNSERISYRKYYKNHPDEWYAEYKY
jgi:hypothetical protein